MQDPLRAGREAIEGVGGSDCGLMERAEKLLVSLSC